MTATTQRHRSMPAGHGRHRATITEDEAYAANLAWVQEHGQKPRQVKHRRPTGDTGQMQAVTEGRAA